MAAKERRHDLVRMFRPRPGQSGDELAEEILRAFLRAGGMAPDEVDQEIQRQRAEDDLAVWGVHRDHTGMIARTVTEERVIRADGGFHHQYDGVTDTAVLFDSPEAALQARPSLVTVTPATWTGFRVPGLTDVETALRLVLEPGAVYHDEEDPVEDADIMGGRFGAVCKPRVSINGSEWFAWAPSDGGIPLLVPGRVQGRADGVLLVGMEWSGDDLYHEALWAVGPYRAVPVVGHCRNG